MRHLFIIVLIGVACAIKPTQAQEGLCIEITKGWETNQTRYFDLATGTLSDWATALIPVQLDAPDANHRAILSPDGVLTLETVATGESIELKTGIDLNGYLWSWGWAWSPDSTRLIFTGSDGIDYFVLSATPDGETKSVPSPVNQPSTIEWSADSHYFSLEGEGSVLMDTSLSALSPVLRVDAEAPARSGWSPDQTRFAGLDDSQVVIYHDGTAEYTSANNSAAYPGWAHEGHRFAYADGEQLLVIHEGAIEHTYPLPANAVVRETSSWSPDSSALIAVVSFSNESFRYDAIVFAPDHEPAQAPIWFVDEGIWAVQRWFTLQDTDTEALNLIMFDTVTWEFSTLQTNVADQVAYPKLVSSDGNSLISIYYSGVANHLNIDRLNLVDGTRSTLQEGVIQVQQVFWQADTVYIAADNQVIVATPEAVTTFPLETLVEAIVPLTPDSFVYADEQNFGIINTQTGENSVLGENQGNQEFQTIALGDVIQLKTGNSGDYFFNVADPTVYHYSPSAWQAQVSPDGTLLAFVEWKPEGTSSLWLEIVDSATLTPVQSAELEAVTEFLGTITWQTACEG